MIQLIIENLFTSDYDLYVYSLLEFSAWAIGQKDEKELKKLMNYLKVFRPKVGRKVVKFLESVT